MLSGEGNGNGETITIGLISKKATLQVQHTFFCTFLAVVLHDYNVKVPETSWLSFMEEMSHVFLLIFFFTAAHFHFWQLSFLIFTLPLKNFRVVPPTKNVSFVVYLSL